MRNVQKGVKNNMTSRTSHLREGTIHTADLAYVAKQADLKIFPNIVHSFHTIFALS